MADARAVFPVEGMSCGMCAATVERRLLDSAGVSGAHVNYATGLASVAIDDGLTLRDGDKRALFLPSVWDGIGDPRQFVSRLKQKAGWDPGYWSPTMTVTRFTTEKISTDGIRAFVGR